MKKTTAYVLAFALAAVAGSAGLAAAFGAPLATAEQRDAIEQAIADKEYAAWRTAMEATLTQEHFDALAAHHAAMSERMALMGALRDAIQDKDYRAYTEAVAQLQQGQLSEGEFNALAEQGAMGFGHGFGMQEMHRRHHGR